MDDWYTFLFGGDELSRPLTLDASSSATSSKILVSKVNGRRFVAGNFSTPSLRQLRERGLRRLLQLRSSSSTSSSSSSSASGGWSFQHIAVTDILEEHAKHPGALFQAASQFNCLEMPNWRATPEHGITGYQYDRTQGPSCALACAAGTVFRNDFVDLGGDDDDFLGQSAHRQLNCLDGVERALRNDLEHFFHVHNGYLFAGDADGEYKKRSPAPLQRLNNLLDKDDDADAVMDALKIGLQTDTEVTFATRFRPPSGATTAATTTPILVSQAYCSAVSVTDACRGGASEPADWRRFATLVLKAAYEATPPHGDDIAVAERAERVYLLGDENNAPSLWVIEDYAAEDHYDALLEQLHLEVEPPIRGRGGRECRQRRNIGFFSNSSKGYRYSNQIIESQPVPPIIDSLLAKVNADLHTQFNGVLVNHYVDGSKYVGAHPDNEDGLSKGMVVALSFGPAARTFRVRDIHTNAVVLNYLHRPRTLLVMDGAAFQSTYKHEIPPELRVKEGRISLTFRCHTV